MCQSVQYRHNHFSVSFSSLSFILSYLDFLFFLFSFLYIYTASDALFPLSSSWATLQHATSFQCFICPYLHQYCFFLHSVSSISSPYIYTTNSTLSVSSTCKQRVLIARASQAMWSLQTIMSVCRFGAGVSLNPACCTYLVNFDVVTVAAKQTQLEGRFDDQPCVSFFQDRGFDVSSGTADI